MATPFDFLDDDISLPRIEGLGAPGGGCGRWRGDRAALAAARRWRRRPSVTRLAGEVSSIAATADRFGAIVTHASLWALDQFGPTTDFSPYWQSIFTPEVLGEE